MTILSAMYGSPDNGSVIATTEEAGGVSIPMSGEDTSNGWRDALMEWLAASDQNIIEPYPEQPV